MAAVKLAIEKLALAAAESPMLDDADRATINDLVEISGIADAEACALLYCVFAARNEGCHRLKLSREHLEKRLCYFAEDKSATEWAREILKYVETGKGKDLISTDPNAFVPLIIHGGGAERSVYFQKYLKHSLNVHALISEKLKSQCQSFTETELALTLTDVLVQRPWLRNGKTVHLNQEQKLGVVLGLLNDFLLISGGPGTGKTSIIFALLRCLIRLNLKAERIRVAAPTGRAAQRISDFLGGGSRDLQADGNNQSDSALCTISGETIHNLLKYNPHTGSFGHSKDNPVPADVVIIDEVSMLDISVMSRLLAALPPHVKLVLLGDKDQLPSVEAGAVLPELLPHLGQQPPPEQLATRIKKLIGVEISNSAIVVLKENYRSQKQILEAAERVNSRDTTIVNALPKVSFSELNPKHAGCSVLEMNPAANASPQIQRVLHSWIQGFYIEGNTSRGYIELVRECSGFDFEKLTTTQREKLQMLFTKRDFGKILTLVREGPFGCDQINYFVQREIRAVTERRSLGRAFSGAMIMIRRNDHGRKLYNGDVGIILNSPSGHRAVFSSGDEFAAYSLDSLPPWDFAFAATVHKSQGSEYDHVLLVLPQEKEHRLLNKQIIYTAITRAKTSATIVSAVTVLTAAVVRNITED